MGKYKFKHHWNFRIITGKYESGERYFSVVEVHYKNKKPAGYGIKDVMSKHYSVKDIKWTNKKIKLAFKKPVLDADNWPKKWKNGK